MHYYVWVLRTGPTPQNDSDVACLLHQALSPFDQEKAGPPKEVECGCTTVEKRRLYSIFGRAPQAVPSPLDEDVGRPWRACTFCQGTGNYVSHRNPVGWWDWWERGGRWTGSLNRCRFPTSDRSHEGRHGFFVAADGSGVQGEHSPLSDVAPADLVRDRIASGDLELPHALVHPVSGAMRWSYAGGRPGHESEDARSDWRECVWSALQQAHFVIVVDIHS